MFYRNLDLIILPLFITNNFCYCFMLNTVYYVWTVLLIIIIIKRTCLTHAHTFSTASEAALCSNFLIFYSVYNSIFHWVQSELRFQLSFHSPIINQSIMTDPGLLFSLFCWHPFSWFNNLCCRFTKHWHWVTITKTKPKKPEFKVCVKKTFF